jgi:hypothetical protein
MCKFPEYLTRDEAKERGLKKYMDGKLCRKKHMGYRSVVTGHCLHCRKVAVNKHRQQPGVSEREKAYRDEYNNSRKNDPAFKKVRHDWKKRNKDRIARQEAERRKANPEKFLMYVKNRNSRLNKATPPWLTEDHYEQIRDKIRERESLNEDTGVKHHVDHIVPLKHHKVCGLHVPWNLRVIPAKDNIRKSNYFNTSDGQYQEFIQSDDSTLCIACQPNRLSRY